MQQSTTPSDESQRPEISVVAPCYNEEAVLAEFHRRVAAVCEGLGRSWELVLVDDGSKDRTWPIMIELADQDAHLVMVKLSRNHGHQLALTAGLSVCRGQRILIMDADLQDPPELLPKMLEMMDQGVEVVYGQRRGRKGESTFKLATASLFYRLIARMSDVNIPRDAGDFRLISRKALEVLAAMPERHRFIRGMVAWIGLRQEPILYDRDPRYAGQTKYPVRKMVRFAIDAITSFSIRPLTMAIWLGLLTALFSLGLLGYALVSWLCFETVHGWTSMLAAIGVLGSVQLFVLGIMGQYLGRLYEQAKGRPLFIVDRIYRGEEKDKRL